jgi:hypothetical protein
VKKHICLWLSLCLSIALLAGCGGEKNNGPAELSYVEKTMVMQQWPGITGSAVFDLKAQLVALPLLIDYTLTLEMDQITTPMQASYLITATSNNALPSLSPFHVYIDEAFNIYVETSAVTEICALADTPVPPEFQTDAQFIRFNRMPPEEELAAMEAVSPSMAEFYRQMMADPYGASVDFMQKLVAANPEFSLGMTQSGDTYKLQWTNANVLDILDKLILSCIDHAEALIDIFPFSEEEKSAILPMTADTAALKESYTTQRDALKPSLQATLDSGFFTLELEDVITDTDYTSSFSFDMDYTDLGIGKITLSGNANEVSAEGVTITLPTSYIDADFPAPDQALMTEPAA